MARAPEENGDRKKARPAGCDPVSPGPLPWECRPRSRSPRPLMLGVGLGTLGTALLPMETAHRSRDAPFQSSVSTLESSEGRSSPRVGRMNIQELRVLRRAPGIEKRHIPGLTS